MEKIKSVEIKTNKKTKKVSDYNFMLSENDAEQRASDYVNHFADFYVKNTTHDLDGKYKKSATVTVDDLTEHDQKKLQLTLGHMEPMFKHIRNDLFGVVESRTKISKEEDVAEPFYIKISASYLKDLEKEQAEDDFSKKFLASFGFGIDDKNDKTAEELAKAHRIQDRALKLFIEGNVPGIDVASGITREYSKKTGALTSISVPVRLHQKESALTQDPTKAIRSASKVVEEETEENTAEEVEQEQIEVPQAVQKMGFFQKLKNSLIAGCRKLKNILFRKKVEQAVGANQALQEQEAQTFVPETIKLNNGEQMPCEIFVAGNIGEEKTFDETINALKGGCRAVEASQSDENEIEIGKAIKESKLEREEVFVITKFDAEKVKDYDSAEKAFQESLDNLGTDYLDLMYVDGKTAVDAQGAGVYAFLEDKFRAGDLGGIGVSNVSAKELKDIVTQTRIVPTTVQVSESMSEEEKKEIAKICKDKNIQVIPFDETLKARLQHLETNQDSKALKVEQTPEAPEATETPENADETIGAPFDDNTAEVDSHKKIDGATPSL